MPGATEHLSEKCGADWLRTAILGEISSLNYPTLGLVVALLLSPGALSRINVLRF
jgi:hypothetical protein